MESKRTPAQHAQYEVLRAALERAVTRSCPAWLVSRREDVVQSALMRIASRTGEGASLESMGPSYIHRVGYTALVDEIRFQRRRRMDQTDAVDAPMKSDAPDPERGALSREIGRAIKACLEALAQTRHVAVSLYLQGSNVPQISTHTGWSRKQAENAVYRGLADMRRCLADKGVQP